MHIILEQLGGNKFIAMTGVKNLLSNGDEELHMKLSSNISKANYLSIILEPSDTYKMIFKRITPARLNKKTFELIEGKEEVIKVIDYVYCDQLQDIFTEITGMDTSL